MLRGDAQRYDTIYRDALLVEEQILECTPSSSSDHHDALARRSQTRLDFARRAGKQMTDQTQEVKKSLADLDTALRLNPRNNRFLLGRAQLYHILGKTPFVIQDCTQILRLYNGQCIASPSERLFALTMRGTALLDERQYRKVMADCDAALAICTTRLQGREKQIVDEELDKLVNEKMINGLQSTRAQAAIDLEEQALAAQASLLQEEEAAEKVRVGQSQAAAKKCNKSKQTRRK
jgi:hypothetical protein